MPFCRRKCPISSHISLAVPYSGVRPSESLHFLSRWFTTHHSADEQHRSSPLQQDIRPRKSHHDHWNYPPCHPKLGRRFAQTAANDPAEATGQRRSSLRTPTPSWSIFFGPEDGTRDEASQTINGSWDSNEGPPIETLETSQVNNFRYTFPRLPLFLDRVESDLKRKSYKRLANQMWRDKGALSWDWSVPLRLLLANKKTSVGFPDDAQIVYLPEQVLVELIGNKSPATWVLNFKSRCSIQTWPASESRGGLRKVSLRGTALSVGLAKDFLAETWAKLDSSSPFDYDSVPFVPWAGGEARGDHQYDGVLRAVWDDMRSEKHRPRFQRADQTPRPDRWTVKSFADYIEHLTKIFMPHGIHRLCYSNSERHYRAVESIVIELFLDPANEVYFSSRALNQAIRFLFRFGCVRIARLLCLRFEESGGTFVPSTFNIMMHYAAKNHDLFNFTYALAMMVRMDVKADVRSWICLLYTVERLDAKYVILRHMKEAGFLEDRAAVDNILASLVFDEFAAHIDAEKDLSSYRSLMDKLYGRRWLGTTCANKLLKVLAERGRLDMIDEVLKEMRWRNAKFNVATLNTVLSACRDLNSVSFAIRKLGEMHSSVTPDRITLQLLFQMAWDARLHNVCRVVWGYACLSHQFTHGMKMKVFHSLWKSESDVPPDDPWSYQAGKVIAGIRIAENMRRRWWNPSKRQADGGEGPPIKKARLRQARRILKADLDLGLSYEPVTSLSMASWLRRAYAMDLEWEQLELIGGGRDLEESTVVKMVKYAISLPMKRRSLKISRYKI